MRRRGLAGGIQVARVLGESGAQPGTGPGPHLGPAWSRLPQDGLRAQAGGEAPPPASRPAELGEVPGGCGRTQGELLLLSWGCHHWYKGVGLTRGEWRY